MGLSALCVKAFTDDSPVVHDDRAYQRIGSGPFGTVQSQLQASFHPMLIVIFHVFGLFLVLSSVKLFGRPTLTAFTQGVMPPMRGPNQGL